MCGRFSVYEEDGETIATYFQAEIDDDCFYQPNYNLAPTQLTVVVADKEGKKTLQTMAFGIRPGWDPTKLLINARADTVAEKPTYKNAFRNRRAIIPANGYYEWAKTKEGKLPYHFKPKEHKMFGFAGIYEVTKDKDGNELKSFVVITTEPNNLNKDIHDRMPAILEPEDYDKWLDVDQTEIEVLGSLLKPFSDEYMEAYPISSLVNSPTNNFPEVLKPLPQ